MSGSSIGSVVGYFVGNLFFPGIGGSIGSIVGGALGASTDKQTINAPSIGDAQTQTSQAGVPRPVVFGHPAPFAGNLIDGETKARKVVDEEEQGGKGGGPKTVVKTEHFYLTYAIRIAEEISGVIRLWRQGKCVYDVRPLEAMPGWDNPDTEEAVATYFAEMQAANVKFLENHRIYLGGEDQLPDPALEMLHGVGNTPYYRGTSLLVCDNEEVTDVGGAAAAWMIEAISCGVPATAAGGGFLASGSLNHNYLSSANPLVVPWTEVPFGDGSDQLRYMAANGRTVLANDGEGFFWRSRDGGATFERLPNYLPGIGGRIKYGNGRWVTLRYVVGVGVHPIVSFDDGDSWTAGATISTNATETALAFGGGAFIVSFSGYYTHANLYSADGLAWSDFTGAFVGDINGACYNEGIWYASTNGHGAYWAVHPGGLWTACLSPIDFGYAIAPIPGGFVVGTFSGYGEIYTTDLHGASRSLRFSEYDRRFYSAASHGSAVVIGTGGQGGNLTMASNDYGATWTPINGAEGYPGNFSSPDIDLVWTGALVGGLPIPDAPSSYVDPETGEVTVEPAAAIGLLAYCGDLTLRAVEEAIAARCNVPAGRFDASALAGITIPGYLIARQATGADCLRPLCQAYFHDLPEPDGIIAVLRGGTSQGVITDADLLLEDSDPFTTGQALEYPLKVSVVTQHPEADYAPIPQTSERYSPDVRASNEVSITVPVPLSADQAMAVAVKLHNVLWAQAEGTEELPLSRKHGHLMVSDAITRNSRRWLVTQSNRADRKNQLRVVYDRESSYHAVTLGNAPPPPTPPGSGLIGPTLFEWMNLPILADSHDKVGFYVAGKGLFSAWYGGVIQASIDSGVSWSEIGVIESASVMGRIETALPDAMSEVIDEVDTVRVNVGRGSLDNITLQQLLYEFNACVIGDEICQFETADYVSDGVYDLTGLTRGRLDTDAVEHDAFDRFVLLNAPVFCEVPTSWIGRDILIRVVSNGTAAENNASESVTWSPARIQTEWAPNHLVTSRDVSNNVSIAWTGRARLGTNAAPVHSVNFLGYRLRITKAGTTVEKAITAAQSYSYTATDQTADFGSATGTLAVAIAAMNRITGASAELTGTTA